MAGFFALLGCVFAFWLNYFLKKRFKSKYPTALRTVILFFALGSLLLVPVPLASYTVGDLLRQLYTAVAGFVLSWFQMPETAAGIVAIAVLAGSILTVIVDVAKDREMDQPARTALMVMPFAAAFSAGEIATWFMANIANGPAMAAQNAIAMLTGQM